MLDITKPRNNYTKFPTSHKQKCDPVLLVQQQHQQHQSKQVHSSKNLVTTAKKPNSSVYSDLKTSLSVRHIGGNLNGRSVGIGRGISIANRIEAAQQRIQLSKATPTSTSTVTAVAPPTISTSNSVREANQKFFLRPEYQDKNFLKDECEIAQAQVTSSAAATVTSSIGKRSIITKNLNAKKSTSIREANELKDAVVIRQCSYNNNNNTNNNNNSSSICCPVSQQQIQQDSIRPLNPSKATITNVMRRSAGVCSSSGYGNTLDSITTGTKSLNKNGIATTANTTTAGTPAAKGSVVSALTTKATTSHRFEVKFDSVESTLQSKSIVPQAAVTTKVQLPSLSSLYNNSENGVINKGSNAVNNKTPIKPLVHRSIPTTNSNERQAYTNSINNNHNSNINSKITSSQQHNLSNGNNENSRNNNNNNSMAAPPSSIVPAIDNEDIKYIDSDENSGMTPPTSLSTGGTATIATGNMGKFVECVEPPLPTIISKNTIVTSGNRMRPKSSIICSNNHNVFEKINNYKYTNGSATPGETNYVPTTLASAPALKRQQNTNIDSNSIKASIEKFNNFSEQKRLPLANAVTLRARAGGTGSTSNLQCHRHSGSDFDNSNSRQYISNNVGSGGGSLTRNPYRTSSVLASNSGNNVAQHMPLKTKVRMADASTATATTIYKQTNNKLQDDRRLQENSNIATEKLIVAGEESIRSVGTKSLLPPSSPATSRYWDRDRDRTTSISTLSSTNHNHIDSDKSSNDGKSEGLCGLRNIGNTCFMNSIIQCLSHTNELTKFLRNYRGLSSSSVTKDQQILLEFAKLIREMWTSNVHSVTPMDLKRAFSSKHRMYSDYNQQDAQEFLRFFLDSLHSALNSGVKGEPLNIDEHLSDNRKADLTWEWYARHENSLIRDLFVGQLKSTLKCTICGNTSVTFDPFWDLSVSLPSSSRCKLDSCFELFIREEVLDGDEMPTCAKCKTRRKCTKSFSIQRFPKYLVIHLKRFSETRWSKMSNIVEFPTGERELNMGPYGANPNTGIHYSLYAISNHMGSTAGGHYVALCKHPVSRKWHEFNDNIVSDQLSESHLVSSSAYILFYERA